MTFSFTDIDSGGDSASSTVRDIANKFVIEPVKLPNLLSGTTALDGFPIVPGFQQGFASSLPFISNEALGKAVSGAGDVATLLKTGFGTNPSSFQLEDSSGAATSVTRKKTDPGMSDSDARLNIVRSRASRTLYQNNGVDTYTSDRGPTTTMKLLKGPDYEPIKAVQGASSDVTNDVYALLSSSGFANFFVTDVNVSFSEKTQIMTTFGDNEVVYYFGKQPIIFNISGLLFDSMENDWFSKFLTLYAGVIRGTQLAKSFSLVQITFPNMIVTGTISALSHSQNSQRDTDIPFQMQFIAKEVIPLPTVMPSGTAQNLVGSLVDFKATRSGLQGYSLGSGALGGGFMESTVKTVGDISSIFSSLTGASSATSSTLSSFRTNIFSPVYGILSSITKIVKSTTGSISSIVSSFTNPVNQVLRDIQSISAQATGVALLVESSINNVIAIPGRTVTNIQNTIRGLKNTAGTISRVPENISETFKRLYGSGRVRKGAAILSSGRAGKRSKAAVLSSGAPYSTSHSNTL